MALAVGDKAQRVLRFLLGLRSDRVAASLVPFGFTDAQSEEGWQLLQALGRDKAGLSLSSAVPATVLEQLDAWENQWFPIASMSLSRHYPAAQARLFLNLSQTVGPEVTISVNLFLERLEQMSEPEGPYGAEGPKARELLSQRGLTPAVVAEARAMLGSLAKVSAAQPRSLEEQQAELARAEKALWDWYLEWSQVARIAIKSRSQLRALGFLKNGKDGVDEEVIDAPEGGAKGEAKPAA